MLKLTPDPTFRAKVDIRAPGGKVHPVRFTFKYMTRSELETFQNANKERSVQDGCLAVVQGWEEKDVDAPYSEEAMRQLFDAYPASAMAIFEAFIQESLLARSGN